jgi:exopolysaccharide biosynthesis polyprenyl glycosylphosphotransferase
MGEIAFPGQRTAGAGERAVPTPPSEASQAGRQVRAHRRVVRGVVALDALAILCAMALAWPVREVVPGFAAPTASGLTRSALVAPFLLAGWMGTLAWSHAYARQLFGSGFEEFQAVSRGSVIAWFLISTGLYLCNLPIARGFTLIAFALGLPLLLAERYAVRRWLSSSRDRGDLRHRVLLVGEVHAVEELARVLERQTGLGYDIVGYVDSAKGAGANPLLSHWIPDGLADLRNTCQRMEIDTVMLIGGGFDLRNVTWDLEGTGVDVVVVPHLADIAAPRMFMRPVVGLPLLYVEEPKAKGARSWYKRTFDVAVTSLALTMLSPVMLVTAALIKLSDGGPVLYKQARVGLHGTVFHCFKFRSMRVDAEKAEAELRARQGHEGALFKMEDDPRVTRVGKFIRRYSIDELPQLLNVLNGTMSLVGPRPQQQWEVDTYSDIARRRLHVRPGMTGLWQVSGRSKLSFDEAIRLDLFYRDNWSMLVDLAIIGRTVKAVVGSDGAY